MPHISRFLPVDIHARINIAAGEVNANKSSRTCFAGDVVRRAALLTRLPVWRTGQIQKITGHEKPTYLQSPGGHSLTITPALVQTAFYYSFSGVLTWNSRVVQSQAARTVQTRLPIKRTM